MTPSLQAALWSLSARLFWVSLGCWLLFVSERFAYNLFDIGVPYHKRPTMFLWLLALPWACYWFCSARSVLLAEHRQPVRIILFGIAALVLAVAFFYASIMLFWTIAKWTGVQFW